MLVPFDQEVTLPQPILGQVGLALGGVTELGPLTGLTQWALDALAVRLWDRVGGLPHPAGEQDHAHVLGAISTQVQIDGVTLRIDDAHQDSSTQLVNTGLLHAVAGGCTCRWSPKGRPCLAAICEE